MIIFTLLALRLTTSAISSYEGILPNLLDRTDFASITLPVASHKFTYKVAKYMFLSYSLGRKDLEHHEMVQNDHFHSLQYGLQSRFLVLINHIYIG